MSRKQLTTMDMGGNSLIHAQLDPRATAPASATRRPWAPWTDTDKKSICWYDDDGNVVCTAMKSAPVQTMKTFTVDGAQPLPTEFDTNLTHVFIDITNQLDQIDLSDWLPTAAGTSVTFRFRKLTNNSFRLLYTDAEGVTYRFVNRRGEFLTLFWDGVVGELNVG